VRYALEQFLSSIESALVQDIAPHVTHKPAAVQLEAIARVLPFLRESVAYKHELLSGAVVKWREALRMLTDAGITTGFDLAATQDSALRTRSVPDLEQLEVRLRIVLAETVAVRFAQIHEAGLATELLSRLS